MCICVFIKRLIGFFCFWSDDDFVVFKLDVFGIVSDLVVWLWNFMYVLFQVSFVLDFVMR